MAVHSMSRFTGLLVAGSLALAPSVASSAPPSPDPTPLAITEGEPWIAYQGGPSDSVHIRLVRADGTGDHPLSEEAVGPEFHPDWSHDGVRLAFVVDDADSRDIWVADADGSNARRIFDCVVPCVDADGPAWSPDDRSIAFRTFDQLADGSFPGSKLQVMDVATETVRTVASTDAPDFIGNGTGPRWSGDGRKLVMDIATIRDAGTETETVDRTAIAVADLDDPAHVLRRITDRVDFPTYPDWHPTDDLIVFMAMPPDPRHPDTTPSNIFTVRSDGSEVAQLTHSGTDRQVWGPTWAPDGASILVTILGAQWTLGSVTKDGSAVVAIPGPIPGAHPRQRAGTITASVAVSDTTATVSPTRMPDPPSFAIKDGEPWIAYTWVQDSDGDGINANGVFLVRPDGGDHHLLNTAAVGHPDWSPDGQHLVVDTEPTDGEEIWIVDADGTNVTVVTCGGEPCGPAAAPAWSPDGGHLALQRAFPREAGEEYDRVAIEVVDLATGATHVVAVPPVAGSEYVEYIGPRWSPDGTQVVFTVMRYPVPPTDENILGSSIAVVKADGSEADTPRILTDPDDVRELPRLEPRRSAHRVQHVPARLLPADDESDEPVHGQARWDRAEPGDAVRRERHAGGPADLDPRR